MATNIIVCAVGYLIVSGVFLIALLRSAARTSDDWAMYISFMVPLINPNPAAEHA